MLFPTVADGDPAMLLPIDRFTYYGDNRRFVTEASDLIGYGFRNTVPQMFDLKSPITGRAVSFKLTDRISDQEGDLLVWVYTAQVSPGDKAYGIEVHILND